MNRQLLPKFVRPFWSRASLQQTIPTYSICNLMGSDRCASEVVVTPLQRFLQEHKDIRFPHRHDFYQIVLFTQGGGSHAIDFVSYSAKAGQLYAMTPGQVHTWAFDAHTEGIIVNFHESFFASVCNNIHFVRDFSLFRTWGHAPVHQLDGEVLRTVQRLFTDLLQEFEGNQPFKTDALRSLLTMLMVKVSRLVPLEAHEGGQAQTASLIRQFENLVERYFNEKRLPRDYAELLHVTPNHLNALVNAAYGMSAGDLIRERVLLEAKRLLVNSDLMIGQVADRLNFEDNAYFSRFFKKYTGLTPEAFRSNQLLKTA